MYIRILKYLCGFIPMVFRTFSSSFTGATPTLRLPPPTPTITPFDSYEEETEQLKNAFMFYLNNSLVRETIL